MTKSSPAPLSSFRSLLHRRKYELLLIALLQHLFSAALLPDLRVYTRYVWPLNMVLLGIFSVGVFAEKSPAQRLFKNVMALLVVACATLPIVVTPSPVQMEILSVCYVVFFALIFIEVLRYLLRPSYINVDIISASACGYLLLLETGIFTMQLVQYGVPDSFRGLSTESFTATYLDIVYFCAITLTSIGFGDITPAHHIAKLATSILGIAGQFYSVVLVGILVAKYTSTSTAR